jgi:hypothetical protein
MTMKKIVVLLLCVWGTAGLSAQNAVEAVVREFYGTVELKAPGAVEWTPAIAGQRITQATVISTGFKSTAIIALGNSLLTVRPLTRLSIEELRAADTEKVELRLQTGRVRADVTPPSGKKIDFSIRSPSATASVRGTSFEFDGQSLRVNEGRVHIRGSDTTAVYVGAGHAVFVDTATGRTGSPAEAARDELAPPPPAGIETVPRAPAAAPALPAVPTAPADPDAGAVNVGTTWN